MANDSVNILSKIQREICRSLSNISLKSTTTNYLGLPLTVPMLYGTGRQLIVPDEFWMSRCLKRFLEIKKGAVLDVGVNVGLYLVKLRALDVHRAYIGIEPNPFCNYYVHQLIRMNGFINARVMPVALSSENRIGKLLVCSRDDSGASIHEDVKAGQDTSSVDVVFACGDELLAQILPAEGLGVIKIDVEGAEHDVIHGLRKSIDSSRPIIYCEIGAVSNNPSPIRSERARSLFSLLRSLNYRVLGVLWDASLREVKDIAELGEPFNCEYILVHSDDMPDLAAAFKAERGIPIRIRKT